MMPTRSNLNVKKCVLASAALIAAMSPCIATAALGEPEASVSTDVAQMRGSIKMTEHANYRLHEIQLPSGTVVREFAGSDGAEFAPGLRTLLRHLRCGGEGQPHRPHPSANPPK
jgi:hypothetical protein